MYGASDRGSTSDRYPGKSTLSIVYMYYTAHALARRISDPVSSGAQPESNPPYQCFRALYIRCLASVRGAQDPSRDKRVKSDVFVQKYVQQVLDGLAVYYNLVDDFCMTSSRLILLNSAFNSQATRELEDNSSVFTHLCIFSSCLQFRRGRFIPADVRETDYRRKHKKRLNRVE